MSRLILLFRCIAKCLIWFFALSVVNVHAENIDPTNDNSQYAWGENIGWLNLEPNGAAGPGVTVGNTALTGYIWGENIGWVNMNPTTGGGVLNDGLGNLSGYAWSENMGWINFAPTGASVFIDACGDFNGKAWGENIGWISFRSDGAVKYKVTSSWTSPVDGVAPETAPDSPIPPWYMSDATIILTTTDCGTGVNAVHYSVDGNPDVITSGNNATINITAEGIHTLSFYSVDNQGNSEAQQTVIIQVDKTPPIVTLIEPADSAVYQINDPVFVNYVTSDNLSGVVSEIAPQPNGSQLDTSSVGASSFSVTATDAADNTTTVTNNYSIIIPGNVDPGALGCQYAWGENIGWINFQPNRGPGVIITDTAVTGMAWAENGGWINLSPSSGGVQNDGYGRLSGSAWSENWGWINFNPSGGGVAIDVNGKFSGKAWGENIGWISFDSSSGSFPCVKSAWTAPPNQPPVSVDDTYSTNEDTTLTVAAPGVLGNDSDVDGDPLSAVPLVGPTNGSLTLNADGSLSYTPNANFNGTDSFTYRANDGTVGSNVATVSLTVNAVNDAPTADAQNVVTDEDTAVAITLTGSDIDGGALTYIVVTPAAHGVISGVVPNLTYTPNANYNGPDSFTFKANDGVVDSNVATVLITINAVNDAPVADAQNVVTDEDTAVAITLTGSDIDGDALSYAVTLLSGPANGVLSGVAPSLTYTPNANYNGPDLFTFKANDSALDSNIATVSITVNAVNDAPVADHQNAATNEDTAVSITLTGSDIDGDALTYSVVTIPANGTLSGIAPNLTYTPNANYTGPDSFTFKANDVMVDSNIATVLVNVQPVNDPPSFIPGANIAVAEDSGTYSASWATVISAGPANEAGQTLVFNVTNSNNALFAVQPSIDGAGNLSFQPAVNAFGLAELTVTLSDNGGTANGGIDTSASVTLAIAVTPVNDPPTISNIADQTIDEDTATGAITFTVSDVETLAGNLVVSAVSSNSVLVPEANIVFGGTGVNRTVSITPIANGNGSATITLTVTDAHSGAASDTFVLTVNAVNDQPFITADNIHQTEQYSDGIIPVTFFSSDIDSATLTFSSTWTKDGGTDQMGLPDGLALSADTCSGIDVLNCTTILSGKANVDAGTYVITVTVNDGQLSASTVITLVVNPEDAQVAFDDANSVAVRVASDGGTSSAFDLIVHVTESQPDLSAGTPLAGDINHAVVSMTLSPVGPGAPVTGTCSSAPASGSGYAAVLSVTCSFNNVEVNTYAVTVAVNGGYYLGGAEDVLVVFDPSLGFTTGGGWFYWPGSANLVTGYPGDKTNYGFNMKYNKKLTNLKGSLLLIRHLSDGTNYRIKSNALYGLALADVPAESYGWASFSGKATYRIPGSDTAEGNHEFVTYVEDHDEPGSGSDKFWFQLKDKARVEINAMSMVSPAATNAITIPGGNIVVPHSSTGGNN